ncbi:hypothetical protein GYB57_11710 [bacterium]|nr:hypothetical protein [bacterium]
MQDFLYQTAEYVLNEQKDQVADSVIILPNRRAALFLKKHFGQLIENPIWSPQIISAEEFLEELSDVNVLDNLSLQFELFSVYQTVVPKEEQDSFDQFIQWGQILLQDFNEIDRYLIDPEAIFSYVNEARAIEIWNLEAQEISDVQHQYLQFWKQMQSLYTAFREHLSKKKQAYSGLSYRLAAENLTTEKVATLSYQHIYFCGFNALTAAEQQIIERLIHAQKATMLFDADEYYLNDELHEAGLFLRQLRKKTNFNNGFKWIGQHFKSPKKIDIYSVPKNIGQAKLAGQLLQEMNHPNNFKDTAVVLCDENLLIPVLQSLPEAVNAVNITMGYPINNSPIYTFFERFIHIHAKAELQNEQRKDYSFFYKDVFNILDHPFMQTILPISEISTIGAQKTAIRQNNIVYLNQEKMAEYLPFLKSICIFDPEQLSVNALLKKLLHLINQAKNFYNDGDENGTNQLQLEYLFHFAKIFNQITDLQHNYNSITETSTFYSIFKQLCRQSTIPFFGEPLMGLQLLGVLETRTIDFKHLIMLSVNEGILPSGKTVNSFLPYDIKTQFGLPTHKEKDAIYAYHFYRLIQRAESVSLLYNSTPDPLGGGEPSRFIKQILHELNEYNPHIKMEEKLVQTNLKEYKATTIKIDKTAEIRQQIIEYFKRGVSPSAINTYLNCPLDFYYRYILKLKEPEELEESIAPNSFGDILHESLEEAYRGVLNQNIVPEMITNLEKIAQAKCSSLFIDKYSQQTIQFGKNHLIFNVAQDYIHLFFEQEKKVLKNNQLRVIGLEENFQTTLTFQYNRAEIPCILRGKIDRIDEWNSNIRVIDYKTGIVIEKDLKLDKPFEEIDFSKHAQAFQLLFYAYLYHKKHITKELPISGIISMRKIKQGLFPIVFGSKFQSDDIIEDFENKIKLIFEEMLTKESFEHKSDAKYCKFCGH